MDIFIFAAVVSTSSTTGRLEDDGEVEVGYGHVDNLSNTVDRPRFGGDVIDAGG